MRAYQYGPNRARQLQQRDEAQAELEIAREQVEALEEERRRAGYRE
jgi:hypothetical protein